MIDGLKDIFEDEFKIIRDLEEELADFVETHNNECTMLEDAKKPIEIVNEMEIHYLLLSGALTTVLGTLNDTRITYLEGMEVYKDDEEETE